MNHIKVGTLLQREAFGALTEAIGDSGVAEVSLGAFLRASTRMLTNLPLSELNHDKSFVPFIAQAGKGLTANFCHG